MKEAFIIADIAGEFDALMRLVKHAPKDCPILAVGDLNDRGPDSASVIEWFVNEPRADAVAGNHEAMMVDYHRGNKIYGRGVWTMPNNGGQRTLWSYQDYPDGVPEKHLKWLETRDFYKIVGEHTKTCLVTHAPLNPQMELWAASEACQVKSVYHPDFALSLMWNRRAPVKRSFYQVFGHCAEWGLRRFTEPGAEQSYALCIDQSRRKILTGFHWPSMELFEEPYEVEKSLGL